MIVAVMRIRQVRMFMLKQLMCVDVAVLTTEAFFMRVVVVPIHMDVAVLVGDLRVNMLVHMIF